MKNVLFAALVVTFMGAQAARAAECTEVTLKDGQVVTGAPIPFHGPSTIPCLTKVGEALAARPALRQVTVLALVPDADRVQGKALRAAKEARTVLAKAGVKEELTSVLAPRTEGSPPPTFAITYDEAPPAMVVARVRSLTVPVSSSRSDEDRKSALAAGTTLLLGETLSTGEHGFASITLADQTVLTLAPGTSLFTEASADGHVVTVLEKGEVAVSAVSSGAWLRRGKALLQLGAGRARVTVDGDGVEVGVLEGSLLVTGAAPLDLRAGGAVHLNGEGTLTDPFPLLGAPSPRREGRALAWTAVPGAKRYRVETASTPDFTDGQSFDVDTTMAPAPSGGGVWRVEALDSGGHAGQSSQVLVLPQ